MNINTKDFAEKIDSAFWHHITHQRSFRDIVNFADIDKKTFLSQLGRQLNKNEYSFKKPDYFYVPKANGVLRTLKVYNLEDTCVYYYCVKSLQDELVAKIQETDNVFGGFRFTPDLTFSDDDYTRISDSETYSSALAKYNFRREWGNYTEFARALSLRHFDNYIHLDIAHFYDDINLDILEERLRNVVQEKSHIINLLFYFLRYSDRRDLGYFQSSVGVPQEELGEMSRLLANFYLSEFDRAIVKNLDLIFNDSNNYIYTRYADDIWICFSNETVLPNFVIQSVSKELSRLKLHLNEGKIRQLGSHEFRDYWRFQDWDSLLAIKHDTAKVLTYLENLLSGNRENRWFSLASYSLKVIASSANNVGLIKDLGQAMWLVNILLNNPQQVFRLSDTYVPFFVRLLEKFPPVKAHLKHYLVSPENIYPNVEYFVLDLLAQCIKSSFDADDLDALVNIYFKSFHEDRWYTRALCIKAFLENIDYLEQAQPDRLAKLMNHMGNSERHQNHLERRYCIRFLSYLRDNRGTPILAKAFTRPHDLKFQDFLQNRNQN